MRSLCVFVSILVGAAACGEVPSTPPDATAIDAAVDAPVDAPIDATPTFRVTVTPAGDGTGTVTSTPSGINCGADCDEQLTQGTSVTLLAVAGAGSTFLGWTGGGCTGTGTCALVVTADVTVTPMFALNQSLVVTRTGSGGGTVSSSPAGIDCGADCSEAYAPGTVVTLDAVPDATSAFAGWSGGGCSGTGTCVVTTTGAIGVVATFNLVQHTLTVNRAGTGQGTVTSTPAGINCGLDCTEAFTTGTGITLQAMAATGSTFTGWSGGGCSGTGPCILSLGAPTTVTATFTIQQHTLTVTRAGTGTGSVSSTPAGITCGTDCSQAYNHGTIVMLAATPATGSTFAGWSGGGCTGTGTCSVTMTAATSVSATFTLTNHTLTVTRAGTGAGTVTSTPAGINCGTDCSEVYPFGTVVTLTAAASTGSAFTGWSGAGCSGTGTCVVTMSAAQNVTATFTTMAVGACDNFTAPNGTTVPNWTERGGDWQVLNGRIHHTTNGGVYGNVITMNSSTQTDGCVRFNALHNGSGSVQAVGGVLRWTAPNTYVVALIQDNTSAGNYNQVYFYQYPGGNDIGGSTSGAFGTNPNVEVCATGNVVRLRVDVNRDGTYETSFQTTTSLAGAGLSGVMTHSFQTLPLNHTHVDDFCWGP